MSKYGLAAQAKMHKVMQDFEDGRLHSGRSGHIVTDRQQAIAIGLSEARRSGAKIHRKGS